jgi:hypothetical protein
MAEGGLLCRQPRVYGRVALHYNVRVQTMAHARLCVGFNARNIFLPQFPY